MRAIKKPNAAYVKAQMLYYNHIRPHSGLNGKTPAEAAGIESDNVANKWEAIIKKATTNRKGVIQID